MQLGSRDVIHSFFLPNFRVKLDATNNPPERVAAGFMQADVAITYLSIIERFFINVEGGQSVRIERAPAV